MFIWLQYIIPQLTLSRLMGWLANVRFRMLKNWAIRMFIKKYKVDMSIAKEQDYRQYPCFNAFFIRKLQPDARPIDLGEHSVVSPADGCISEFGAINNDQLLQAKGISYTLSALLAGDDKAVATYQNGSFITVYLSPKDYHRVHMPSAGNLLRMRYVPGRLFSVNQQSAAAIPNLFVRNERVICHFKSEYGPFAVIMVGAMIVGGMSVDWHGAITPPHRLEGVMDWDYTEEIHQYNRGAEMGYFNLGSTVILLFPRRHIEWTENLKAGDILQMGQKIGRVNSP